MHEIGEPRHQALNVVDVPFALVIGFGLYPLVLFTRLVARLGVVKTVRVRGQGSWQFRLNA